MGQRNSIQPERGDIIVSFTLPPEEYDRMKQSSGTFYLDVFGIVRDRESTWAIGLWSKSGVIS